MENFRYFSECCQLISIKPNWSLAKNVWKVSVKRIVNFYIGTKRVLFETLSSFLSSI